jgi:anti-sigma regulatory factor (Ser/Thr protein kinase)/serine/threonine protein phosphatase PrpC
MEVAYSEHVPITDDSSVGEARRRGLLLADRLGFDSVRSGEFGLLITEAARNVLLHGGGGQTIIAGTKTANAAVGRVLAMDNGPGIPDIGKAMSDGFSTGGTMGGGMGAMKRIATSLDVFTGRSGTIVLLELGSSPKTDGLQIAGITVPYPGERACGDAWTYHQTTEKTVILLVDGLGHGPYAAEAAEEAIETFHQYVERPPNEILTRIHEASKKTRGAVAAVAEIRPHEKMLTYAAVGNIAASVITHEGSRSLVSHSGTLGVASPRVQEFKERWRPDSIFIMHSDGLQTRWDLSSYAGLASRHPALIGAALLRDFRRQRDDASVVVVKAAA